MNSAKELSPIQEYYNGSKILVTGATGFLGRVLISKLLSTCPGVEKIYLLIRNKKGKKLDQRLDDLFADVVFDKLKQECPEFRAKVVGISGDCSLQKLGLIEEDIETLTNNVTLVFHSAATVRFDEPLRTAVAINVRGTRDLLQLAVRMRNLRHVIHVSTAYSHCPRSHIDEQFYATPMQPDQLITLTETVAENVLDDITPHLLGDFPNTYAYTKACAEEIVRAYQGQIPMAIVRPSIIVSTYKEPFPGWINNLYGPVGITAAAMPGLLCSLHCDSVVNANIIPVDMVANAILASPWDDERSKAEIKENKKVLDDVRIYNYESSTDQPITWGEFQQMTYEHGIQCPTIHSIRYYNLVLRKHLLWHQICVLFLHLIPGFIGDVVLKCLGKKPMLMKGYEKLHKFATIISYFSTTNWTFESKNVRNMCNSMSEEDRKLFLCDVKELDWKEYFKWYPLGIRTYLLNDPVSTLDYARVKLRRLYVVHLLMTVLQGSAFFYVLYLCQKALF